MPKQRSRPPAVRNAVARAPIMRKGGVHQKPRSGQRQQAKRALQREVRLRPPSRGIISCSQTLGASATAGI